MGIIIFLFALGALGVLVVLIGAGLSLFSGIFGYDNDPYEQELRRMDFEDEVLSRLDDRRFDNMEREDWDNW